MKKLLSTLMVLFFLASVATFTGCKYEEGPKISFTSKTKRIVNVWNYSKVINADGSEQNVSSYDGIDFDLQESGVMRIVYLNNVISTATWAFSDDKKQLVLTDDDGDTETFTIQRLASDELWFTDDDGITYQLVPKP